jgi:hypothetical protein
MFLGNFQTEPLTLRKKNGETHAFDGFVATGKSKIMTEENKLPVEEGDTIERKLPNGMVETYTVMDRGYVADFNGVVPPHYQMKVRKGTNLEQSTPSAITNVYNLTGPNARVNIQSADSSINISSVSNEELFPRIGRVIGENAQNDARRIEMLAKLGELQVANKATIGEKYRQFIASAADHMTLLTPFLPALTALLLGTQ